MEVSRGFPLRKWEGRKEFTNQLKFHYIMCAVRRLAHYSCSPSSVRFLPFLCGFGSRTGVARSSAVPARPSASLGGVWYLPSWDPDAEVCGERRVQTEV